MWVDNKYIGGLLFFDCVGGYFCYDVLFKECEQNEEWDDIDD